MWRTFFTNFLAIWWKFCTIFTTLLLGHSHLTYLFSMFFRYQWCYLCFLPTLFPSCCLVETGGSPYSSNISDMNSASADHSAVDGTHPFVMWLGEGVASYNDYLKEGGVVEFTTEMVICHLTKKYLWFASK